VTEIASEFGLDRKVVVISTFGSWWLEDLALSLAEAGARIVLVGPNKDFMEVVAVSVHQTGGEAVSIPVHLQKEKDVEGMTGQVITDFGRIDVLINALSSEFWKPFLETTQEEWRSSFDMTVMSHFLCTKMVGKAMVAQRQGSIVNAISGLAQRGLPNGTAYCAGTGSVLQMTRALALEWASQQVRVNAVGIGWMAEQGKKEGKDRLAGYIPLRRRAEPKDVIPLILFLASEASSYLSGNIYVADGGLMARG
jgi:NAD(P)-dependent dehydrogenase (short-subunit alcohol dehydrogenase family)